MGTRGLIGFTQRGQRHATYNHFDSYPAGLGKDIVAFLLSLNDEDIARLIRNLSEMTWVDGETKPSAELQERYSRLGFSETNVGRQNLEDWYCLLHHTQGAAMLPALLDGQLKHAVDSMDFLGGFSCEWAYFIDFENRKLEVWAEVLIEELSFEQLRTEGADVMVQIQVRQDEEFMAQVEDYEGQEDDDEAQEDDDEAQENDHKAQEDDDEAQEGDHKAQEDDDEAQEGDHKAQEDDDTVKPHGT